MRNTLMALLMGTGVALASATATAGVLNLSQLGTNASITATLVQTTVDTWDVQVVVDSSGYTGDGEWISAMGLKVSNSLNAVTRDLAPLLFDPSTIILNQNTSGGGGQGFFDDSDGNDVALSRVLVGGVNTWEYKLVAPLGSATTDPFTGDPLWALHFEYSKLVERNRDRVVSSYFSAHGTPVETPEPATLGLLGVGLMGALGLRWRRAAI